MSDAALGSAASFALTHGSYIVRTVTTVSDAADLLGDWDPDLALVDLDVESGRGLDLFSGPGLRRRVPLIAVTRNGELDVKLRAFDRGADDLLNIPFLPEELVARAPRRSSAGPTRKGSSSSRRSASARSRSTSPRGR